MVFGGLLLMYHKLNGCALYICARAGDSERH